MKAPIETISKNLAIDIHSSQFTLRTAFTLWTHFVPTLLSNNYSFLRLLQTLYLMNRLRQRSREYEGEGATATHAEFHGGAGPHGNISDSLVDKCSY